jgi:pSer/pThr/pTyr-binding forkhead associated (FHA) protein
MRSEAKLVLVLECAAAGVTFSLKRNDALIVGRDPRCDVVLKDIYVGKQQALFKNEGGITTVEDAESPAGTYVNDRLIRKATAINPGDSIKLGGMIFEAKLPVNG